MKSNFMHIPSLDEVYNGNNTRAHRVFQYGGFNNEFHDYLLGYKESLLYKSFVFFIHFMANLDMY